MSIISQRMSLMRPSGTLAIMDMSRTLKAQGISVFDLAEGESDFATPAFIADAAKKAIDDGFNRYTAVDGIPSLKKAIQDKYIAETDTTFEMDEIIVGTGAKQLIFAAMMGTVNPGDEVVFPTPCWVSYRDIAEVFGAKTIAVPCQESAGFQPDLAELEKQFNDKTKWLILNSPNNPTGAVYSKAFYAQLEKVLEKYPNIYVMSDEIYEEVTYTGERAPSMLVAAPNLKNRTLVVNGMSKKYAMTGWRMGYAVGPRDIVGTIKTLIGQSTTNATSIVQVASASALQGPQDFFDTFLAEYTKRRALTIEAVSTMDGLTFSEPDGAFYMFVNCQYFLGKHTYNGKVMETDVEFVAYLMGEAKVSVVPGSAFGMDGYFRICYAKSEDVLQAAFANMKKAIEKLS